jgi:hypothetical protein
MGPPASVYCLDAGAHNTYRCSDFPPSEAEMRAIALVSCLSFIACASANGPAASSTATETIRVGGGAGGTMTAEIHPTVNAIGATIPFTVDRTWGAIRTVYDSLSLPVATFDPATHTIASPTLRLRRRLGETSLSKYINCGNTQGGQSADSYEIHLTIQTVLRAADAGTTSVLSTVSAEGRPITLAGEYTHCASTGTLEGRVGELVKAQLNR